MVSVQSAFRTTPGAVTWFWTAAVMIAGGSSLSAHADPAAADPADQAMASIHAEAIRADMRFLADDLLEGRGIETQGYGVAARYMASQFEALGLQPAGSAGYLQNVPLRSSRIDEAKATLTWVRAGVPETLTLRQDYIPSVDPVLVRQARHSRHISHRRFQVQRPENRSDGHLRKMGGNPLPPAAGRHGTTRAGLQCRGSLREIHLPVRLLCHAGSTAPALECGRLLRRSLWRQPHSQLIEKAECSMCTGEL
jgi:hypothetical protein